MSIFKRKFKWKNILSFVLVGVLLIGSVAGLGAIFNKDTKTISSTAFAVGCINEQGNYAESKTSIYTKDMFECQGLSIEPDFEATGTYKVFYYDENKNFIGATEDLYAEDGVYNKGNSFPFAKYARIMITPDVPTADDGKEVKDFKIRFYEVYGYANEYNITVDKKQEYKLDDLTNYAETLSVQKDKIYNNDSGKSAIADKEGFSSITLSIDSNGIETLAILFENVPNESNYLVIDKVANVLSSGTFDTGDGFYFVDMPANAVYIIINFESDNLPALYNVK